MQEKLGRFKLLKGVEANIRADGSVDVDDEVLADRDWVMASIHSGFDKDLTERVLAAMENPHVDCIGHLTGRKLNRRAPADVDLERVVEKALETGTFLEINAQPDRLDLRDAHARLAGEAGVKIVISSDSHEIPALSNLEFGVAQARRAWLGPGSDPEHAPLGRGQEAAQEVKYRAVIFDLWQTLVPWPADAAEGYYRWMADAYGAPYERFHDAWTSSFRERATGPIEDNLRSVATALAVEPDFDRVLAWRLDWTRRSLVPRPDAVPTIEALRARGQKVGLITVCSQEVADLWDETPFAGLFDATVFSSSVGLSKPDLRDLRARLRATRRRSGRLPVRRRRGERRAAGRRASRDDGPPAESAGRGAHARRRSVAGRVDRAPLRGRRSDQVTQCY